MSQKHYVIFIPGLGNDTNIIRIATLFWRKYNLKPLVYPFNWHEKNTNFQRNLSKLSNLISKLSQDQCKVSLVGCSAGGSVALNAFYENNKVSKIVNVCGRLRKGTQKGFRSFTARTKSSKLFAESVELCEERTDSLSEVDRKMIMTIRPLLGDELVPGNTTTINGAKNITLPTGEHLITIGVSLTIFAKRIINFLKN